MANKVTINQVAEICGVSKTTISRYLNHKYENISAETRQRIEQVITELNYRPDRSAQRLKASRSMLIGCCIGDIASPFAGLLLKGVTETCESAGYQVLFADCKENPMREQRAIEGFLENRVDGLIVNSAGDNDEFLIGIQRERGVPVVLADRSLQLRGKLDTVINEYHRSTTECVERMLNCGYRNITVKDLPGIIWSSVKTTAVIEYLVCVSGIMGYVMTYTHIPAQVAAALLGLTSNKYIILLIMNIILLAISCFMDPTPAVLLFTPIFLPIVQTWGMSPVHFGLMMIMNLCVGTLTPPVGAILFAGYRTHNVKIEQIIGMLMPFFIVILVSLLLVTYVPWFTMAIPNALHLA